MTTYVIGDVQGCLNPLRRLLERVQFDPAADRLVFAGDLVARGPDSAGTLRFVRGLGAAATTVLGNHDLYLIGVAHGAGEARDGLDQVLGAADADELVAFLCRQRLAWRDARSGTLVVHAGVAPQWTADDVLAQAAEVEAMLRDAQARTRFLPRMHGNEPARWSPQLAGPERLRFAINCLTRARYCSADGSFEFKQKGAPGSQPPPLQPWFALPGRRSRDARIVFGHWSSLGRVEWPEFNVVGLDTGCVWGGPLTALSLEDGRVIQVDGERR
jgi:bis(5'-nucleosyl)-tetraphosphatase (symmetrical)